MFTIKGVNIYAIIYFTSCFSSFTMEKIGLIFSLVFIYFVKKANFFDRSNEKICVGWVEIFLYRHFDC